MPKITNGCTYERTEEFEAISGPLRLATKYELDDLHSRLAESLALRWPSTLKEWDRVTKQAEAANWSSVASGHGYSTVNPGKCIPLNA